MDRRVDVAVMMRVAFWAGPLADAQGHLGDFVTTGRTGFAARIPTAPEGDGLPPLCRLGLARPPKLAKPPIRDGPSPVMIFQQTTGNLTQQERS
jgi:hypothetical protein